MNAQPPKDRAGPLADRSADRRAPGGTEPDFDDSVDTEAVVEGKRTALNRIVVVILLVVALAILVPMLKMFLTPLVLACTFVSLFYPLYSALLRLLRGRRGLSALACCIILVLGFVLPAYLLGYLVSHQLLTLYRSVEPVAQAFVKGENTDVIARLRGNPMFSWLAGLEVDWRSTALDALKAAGSTMAGMVNKTSRGALEVVLGLLATLFIMFYLFMDGERIIGKLRQLIPLRSAYQGMIIERFLLVSRATVKGTLVIASIQGTLGAIILLVFGVKTWLLWGVVMVALALVPMMGAWMILVPAGIIQLATGHVWQGVVILALSFGFVSTIDNVLRPKLVGQNARMHDLLIFFSTIGGLAMFGPVGVITGPVIMAFFVSIVEIYGMELKRHLEDGEQEAA